MEHTATHTDDLPARRPALHRSVVTPRFTLLLIALVIGTILCGSLAPFSFAGEALTSANAFGMVGIGRVPSGTSDLLLNVAGYVPLGMLLCWWIRRRCGLMLVAVVVTTVAGGGVSILAESVQTAIPQRVASWVDVAANTCGAALGALAAPSMAAALLRVSALCRRRLERTPLSAMPALVAIAILLHSLFPFDLATTSASLRRGLERAVFNPLSTTDSRSPGQPATEPFAPLLGALAGAGAFAVYGYFAALRERWRGANLWRAGAAACLCGASLAMLIETLQFFLASHVLDVRVLILNAYGACCGAWTAVALTAHSVGERQRGGLRAALPGMVLVAALVVQVILILGAATAPFVPAAIVRADNILWIPMADCWPQPVGDIVVRTESVMVSYGALGLTMAALAWRVRPDTSPLIIPAGCALVAGIAEGLQLFVVGRTPSATQPFLAGAAALLVVVVWHHVRPRTIVATDLNRALPRREPVEMLINSAPGRWSGSSVAARQAAHSKPGGRPTLIRRAP